MAPDLGLKLNYSKSELICDNQSVSEAMLLEAPVLHLFSGNVADILGSPLENVEPSVTLFRVRSRSSGCLGTSPSFAFP